MTTVSLGEISEINPRPPTIAADETVSFVGMAQLDASTAQTDAGHATPFSEVSKGYTVFADGDLLVAKITPCFENNKIGQAQLSHKIGVGSTEFHVLRPGDRLNNRYLLHFLRQSSVRHRGEMRMTGSAGQRRVPVAFLKDLQIPLPPLDEQRRIAAILDRTEVLRAKRREVLARLDLLTQSVFSEMFASCSFEAVPAGILMPNMRNGLSPATAGRHSAQVLTLSAVTRGTFDPSAIKQGAFSIEPPAAKRVTTRDFLMCRGNGNKALVGAGTYAREDRPDLVFPDTVIAGTVDTTLVTLPYLEAAWKRREVRTQIESVARTTNGTYKVNQLSLAGIRVPLPPLNIQREFASRANLIGQERAVVARASAIDDELFTALEARAFSGEL